MQVDARADDISIWIDVQKARQWQLGLLQATSAFCCALPVINLRRRACEIGSALLRSSEHCLIFSLVVLCCIICGTTKNQDSAKIAPPPPRTETK
jgi:hypothetical protein